MRSQNKEIGCDCQWFAYGIGSRIRSHLIVGPIYGQMTSKCVLHNAYTITIISSSTMPSVLAHILKPLANILVPEISARIDCSWKRQSRGYGYGHARVRACATKDGQRAGETDSSTTIQFYANHIQHKRNHKFQ